MDYATDDITSFEEGLVRLKRSTYETATVILREPKRNHQDWFHENGEDLNAFLEKRMKGKVQEPRSKTRASTAWHAKTRSRLQKCT